MAQTDDMFQTPAAPDVGQSVWQPLADRMRPLAERFFALCDKFQVDRPQEWGDDIAATRQRIEKVLEMNASSAP